MPNTGSQHGGRQVDWGPRACSHIRALVCCRPARASVSLQRSDLAVVAMNSFFFLRHDMRAARAKKQWDKDEPLTLEQGGTMGSIHQWSPEERSKTLRQKPGSKIQALGCLTQLANDLSCPSLTISTETIDQVGRRLWTESVEVYFDTQGPHQLLGMEGDSLKDPYWKDHQIVFPNAWPEKASIAVSISDPAAWPAKVRVLCNDVIVLSFWRYVGLALQLHDVAQASHKSAKAAAGKTPSPEQQDQLDKAELLLQELELLMSNARALQRNVPFTFIYCPDEKFRFDEALSLREDIEFLREMTGLSGWDRVMVCGMQRDSMRSSLNRSIKHEEIAESFKQVRWAQGRELTTAVVEKLMPLYDKFAGCTEVTEVIQQAFSHLARSSPFEDYSKLSVISGRCSGIPETCWVMQGLMYDQILVERACVFCKTRANKNAVCVFKARSVF